MLALACTLVSSGRNPAHVNAEGTAIDVAPMMRLWHIKEMHYLCDRLDLSPFRGRYFSALHPQAMPMLNSMIVTDYMCHMCTCACVQVFFRRQATLPTDKILEETHMK